MNEVHTYMHAYHVYICQTYELRVEIIYLAITVIFTRTQADFYYCDCDNSPYNFPKFKRIYVELYTTHYAAS